MTKRTPPRSTVRVRQLGAVVGAAIGVLVAAPNARGQASPPSTPTVVQSADTGAPRTLEVLLRRIQRLLDSSGTPGASLAIVRHDSVLFAGALGLARQDPPQRATAATHFRAGSTGKLFIGLTALALVREGRLVLDQPLREAWPGLVVRNPWEATHPLRLIHLLEHTAGLDDSSIRAYASNDPLLSLEQGLAIDAGRLAARWPPGTRFAYSNVGPAIVAHVIERIEGVPFEQVVQRRWFDRLGMRSATYFEPDPFAGTMATLYLPGRRAPVPYWHVFARPIGALNTTAPDMAALLRLLTGRGIVDGDTLIPPADLDRAEYSRTWSGTRHGLSGVGYGLTLYRTDGDDGRIWAGHAGGVEGGLSDLSYLPTEGRGYSLQVNATRSRALALMSAQVRAFLTADLPPPARPAIATPAADFAARFTGWYRPITPRPQIVAAVERLIGLARVRLATDSLRVEPLIGTASSYVPVDSLTFRPPRGEAATLVFHRDDPLTTAAVMEGFSGGATFARVPLLEVGFIAVATIAWGLALFAGPLAAVVLALQWAWRRWKRAPRAPINATTRAWWCAASASAAVFTWGWCAVLGFQDVRRFGRLSLLSVPVAVAPLLYLLLTLAGIWFAVGRLPAGAGRATQVGRWTVRAAMVAHLVAVAYAARHGLIGYRPWA